MISFLLFVSQIEEAKQFDSTEHMDYFFGRKNEDDFVDEKRRRVKDESPSSKTKSGSVDEEYEDAQPYQHGGGDYPPNEHGSHYSTGGHGKHEGRRGGERRSDDDNDDDRGHGRSRPSSKTHHFSRPDSRSPTRTSNHPTFKIYCKANPRLNLAIRDGRVVLARADPSDERQHWIKDDKFGANVRDDEGHPGFSLINLATGEALKHNNGEAQPVELARYKPNECNTTLIWSESKVIEDEGYKAIRAVDNIHLNMDADLRDSPEVCDGNRIVLWGWKTGNNQIWKIKPH
ncbi:ricin B-like lectin R40G3 [Hibiscus syriacus]|nr:ricin B-like lectin R40G3 [Hibiscus syriacus]